LLDGADRRQVEGLEVAGDPGVLVVLARVGAADDDGRDAGGLRT
jgi:hypothetical protein